MLCAISFSNGTEAVEMPKGNPSRQTIASEKYQKKAGYFVKAFKIKKEVAESFTAACENAGVSQASQLMGKRSLGRLNSQMTMMASAGCFPRSLLTNTATSSLVLNRRHIMATTWSNSSSPDVARSASSTRSKRLRCGRTTSGR